MLADVAPLAGARVVQSFSKDVTLVLGTPGASETERRKATKAGLAVREPEYLLNGLMRQQLEG